MYLRFPRRYHSESGWHTLCEVIVEHYGLEVDQSAITIFICLVPVIMDACVKLWVCQPVKFHVCMILCRSGHRLFIYFHGNVVKWTMSFWSSSFIPIYWLGSFLHSNEKIEQPKSERRMKDLLLNKLKSSSDF